jgi:hypothetical protein
MMLAALVGLAGCDIFERPKPGEDRLDFEHRRHYERQLDSWNNMRRINVDYVGGFAAGRILMMPEAQWRDPIPIPGFSVNHGATFEWPLCTNDPDYSFAPDSPPPKDCWRLTYMKEKIGCARRGLKETRCTEHEITPGALANAEVLRRLTILARAPCRALPAPKDVPSPAIGEIGEMSGFREALNVFHCYRYPDSGRWYFSLAIYDRKTNVVFVIPDDLIPLEDKR